MSALQHQTGLGVASPPVILHHRRQPRASSPLRNTHAAPAHRSPIVYRPQTPEPCVPVPVFTPAGRTSARVMRREEGPIATRRGRTHGLKSSTPTRAGPHYGPPRRMDITTYMIDPPTALQYARPQLNYLNPLALNLPEQGYHYYLPLPYAQQNEQPHPQFHQALTHAHPMTPPHSTGYLTAQDPCVNPANWQYAPTMGIGSPMDFAAFKGQAGYLYEAVNVDAQGYPSSKDCYREIPDLAHYPTHDLAIFDHSPTLQRSHLINNSHKVHSKDQQDFNDRDVPIGNAASRPTTASSASSSSSLADSVAGQKLATILDTFRPFDDELSGALLGSLDAFKQEIMRVAKEKFEQNRPGCEWLPLGDSDTISRVVKYRDGFPTPP